jgi:hypothetical protein
VSAGWAPIRVAWRDGAPVADVCRTAGASFDEPFFDETIDGLLRRPFNLLFRREVALDDLPAADLEPDGLILHASRCGSTLISRLLATDPGTLVVSEAGAVDAVLRSRFRGVDDARRADWLRRVVAALGHARGPEPRRFFPQLGAWSTLELPLLRRAYPGVPWIFVYRDPLEILVSQKSRRGLHMIPGALPAALFELPDAATRLAPDEYMARVLGAILGAARDSAAAPSGRLLHWRDLPQAFADVVAPHFSLDLDAAADERLAAVARADAKNPVLPFADDSEAKRLAASPELRAATDAWARPAYDELEARRGTTRAAA